MNQELIEQLMDECTEYWTDKGDIYFDKKKFAALVAEAAVAAEREEIDKLFDTDLGCCYDAMGQEALNQMRAAIKARGDTK